MITEEGSGILIDWDLSKKVVKDGMQARQHSRTVRRLENCSTSMSVDVLRQGTWQFISIARLSDPSSGPHEVCDDLESFFWVLLYLIAKCRKDPAGTPRVSEQMQLVFDQYYDIGDDHGITRGGGGKLACLRGIHLGYATVEEIVKTPCSDIVEDLRSLFQDSYSHLATTIITQPEVLKKIRLRRERDESVQSAIRKLQSSKEVLAIIDKHLDSNWDVDDDRNYYKVDFMADTATSTSGRKRKAEDGGGNYNEKHKGKLPSHSSQRRRTSGAQLVRSSLVLGSGSRTRTR